MTKSNSAFRRLAALAAVAVCAVGGAGCIKNEQKTTIQKDGSGSVSQSVSIDLESFKKLAEMMKAMGGPQGGDAKGPDFTDEDLPMNLGEIEKKAKSIPGLELKNAKAERKDGKYVMSFDATFAEWSLLGKANLFSGAADLVKNADGSYTFTLDALGGQGDKPAGGKPGDGADGLGGMDPAAMMPMLEPFLGTLEIKEAITLPGEIVETNGTKSEDGSTVSWKIGFKELMGGKGANLMKVTFKGEGLDLKPFSYKPDPKELMKDKPGKPAGGPPPDAPPAPPAAPMEEPAMDMGGK